MELSELRQVLPAGQPAYRATQVYRAIYQQKVGDLIEIFNLPARVRTELASHAELGLPVLDRRYESIDGTRRYLLRLSDGRTVETVLMPEDDRDTVCISSQVGCPVDCKFCMTALMGLERSLTPGEIVGQVLFVARDNGLLADNKRFNIVMMGMGEPLLNLPAVLKATRILCDPDGVGMSERRITVSTSGIIPKIEELGQAEVRPKLAISLNASTEEQRQELMPITRKWHLSDLMEACRAYPLRPWEKLTFEYVLARRRQRHRRRRAPGREAARQPELQSESDRAESRAGDSVCHACRRTSGCVSAGAHSPRHPVFPAQAAGA